MSLSGRVLTGAAFRAYPEKKRGGYGIAPVVAPRSGAMLRELASDAEILPRPRIPRLLPKAFPAVLPSQSTATRPEQRRAAFPARGNRQAKPSRGTRAGLPTGEKAAAIFQSSADNGPIRFRPTGREAGAPVEKIYSSLLKITEAFSHVEQVEYSGIGGGE